MVRICQACGDENPDDAIKCSSCKKVGTLGEIESPQGSKKELEEPTRGPEWDSYNVIPNKISLQYYQIGVSIESIDKDTEELATIAIRCIELLAGAGVQQQPNPQGAQMGEEVKPQESPDYTGDKDYQKLINSME